VKPVGIGTSQGENLTSYITRLAYEHCVTVKDLVVHELLPYFGRAYLLSRENNNLSAFWKYASSFNSLNPSTHDWIQLLEKLTLQRDLSLSTMIPWSNILSARNIIRKTRAWCPQCYDEYRWQSWKVEMIGAMLDATPDVIGTLQNKHFAEAVELCLNQVDHNISALSRRLHVSRRTIRDWAKGVQIP
jgi:TniQ